jgi:hypothetical protein
MRFSLKWILVAAVYVAVAAAAFSQPSWVYADILWAASLLAIVFAGLVAIVGQGRTRVSALGFLLASLCFVVYVTAASLSNSTPMTRLLDAAGYAPPVGTIRGFRPPSRNSAPAPLPTAPVVDYAQYVRAANAVGMMAFGLLGMLLASLALRQCRDHHGSADSCLV